MLDCEIEDCKTADAAEDYAASVIETCEEMGF